MPFEQSPEKTLGREKENPNHQDEEYPEPFKSNTTLLD